VKWNLKRHLLFHSGEKPFKCKYCNKKFATNSLKKFHERIHEKNAGIVPKKKNEEIKIQKLLEAHDVEWDTLTLETENGEKRFYDIFVKDDPDLLTIVEIHEYQHTKANDKFNLRKNGLENLANDLHKQNIAEKEAKMQKKDLLYIHYNPHAFHRKRTSERPPRAEIVRTKTRLKVLWKTMTKAKPGVYYLFPSTTKDGRPYFLEKSFQENKEALYKVGVEQNTLDKIVCVFE